MQHTEITCVRNRSCQSIIVNRSNHSFRLIQKILIHHEKHVVNYRVVKNTALRMLNLGECLPLTRFGRTHCCFNQFLHGEHILDQKSQKEPFSGYILSGPHYLQQTIVVQIVQSAPHGPCIPFRLRLSPRRTYFIRYLPSCMSLNHFTFQNHLLAFWFLPFRMFPSPTGFGRFIYPDAIRFPRHFKRFYLIR